MSAQSCIDAAVTLLTNANLGFATIADGQTLPNRITPDICPAILIFEEHPQGEAWMSGGRVGTGGSKKENWNLQLHLWAYYPDLTTPSAFRALLDSVKAVFRSHPRLGGLGDTANTTIFQAQGRIKPGAPDWQEGQGFVVRHALISVEIQELIEGI